MSCTVQPLQLYQVFGVGLIIQQDWLWNKKAADAKSEIYKPRKPPQNISACLLDWG